MIEKRTVFVLGAGASCPYGFPTARGLRGKIIREFVSAYERLLEARKRLRIGEMNEGYPRPGLAQDFVEAFTESSTDSIDLFLSRNPRFQKIGKMAICLSILQAERESLFREEVKNPDQDWYIELYKRLTREFTGKDGYTEFGKIPIAFVTFNYDRSLEYFLFNSLLHAFEGADQQKIKDQIAQIPIIHVYGRIAGLEWEAGQSGLAYWKHLQDTSLVNLATVIKNLYVVHEERNKPQLEKAHEEISKAERIFFLGFGYADENLEALGLPRVLKPKHLIYGTAMGFSAKEITDKQLLLAEGLRYPHKPTEDKRSQVHLKDYDCVALLREFL